MILIPCKINVPIIETFNPKSGKPWKLERGQKVLIFRGKVAPIRGWSENFHFQEGLGSFSGNISEQDTSIIKQARRILFNNGEP